jgi:hypothetical protein
MSSYGRKVDEMLDDAISTQSARDIEVSYERVGNNCGGCTTEVISHREYSIKEEPAVLSVAEKRKATPVFSGVLSYFPDAVKYVSQVSKAGNDQHHPDKPLHWDRAKSTDELDALARHLVDHSVNPMDTDGMLHLGKVAWRALAMLQKYLEDDNVRN